MQAIGIDIGTTSICGVVIDIESGGLVKSITRESASFIKGTAEWEKIQSVQKIIDIAVNIVDELISDKTKVIGVTGQMHGIVYVDSKGKAVSPLYTWQDERGNQPYGNTTYAAYLQSSSGYGNVTDFYNRQNNLIPDNAVGFCTIHDYFVMYLCSLKKPVIHITDAASFGMFDLNEKRFTYENGMDYVEGYVLAGIYKNIPVSAAIGDNQASALSSFTEEDQLLINVGTGSQVSVICDEIIVGDNIETRPFFENKYLAVGAALCGGRAYAVLKDFYKAVLSKMTTADDTSVYNLMNQFLEEDEGETLCVDTRFAGTRKDKNIRGMISNISIHNFTPAALTKGVLEGMMQELSDMYNSIGVNINGIVGSGNGIRKNKALIKIAEKTFRHSLKIPKHTEEAAFGAALYGMISVGYYKDMSEVRKLIKII